MNCSKKLELEGFEKLLVAFGIAFPSFMTTPVPFISTA